MTREEAIYRLMNTAWIGTDKDRDETEEAVAMAIEALSEPMEMVEYISKEDAINSIIHHKDLTWVYDARSWAEELLEDAEVVEVSRCDGNTDYEDEILTERKAQAVSWQNEKGMGRENERAKTAMLGMRR